MENRLEEEEEEEEEEEVVVVVVGWMQTVSRIPWAIEIGSGEMLDMSSWRAGSRSGCVGEEEREKDAADDRTESDECNGMGDNDCCGNECSEAWAIMHPKSTRITAAARKICEAASCIVALINDVIELFSGIRKSCSRASSRFVRFAHWHSGRCCCCVARM